MVASEPWREWDGGGREEGRTRERTEVSHVLVTTGPVNRSTLSATFKSLLRSLLGDSSLSPDMAVHLSWRIYVTPKGGTPLEISHRMFGTRHPADCLQLTKLAVYSIWQLAISID